MRTICGGLLGRNNQKQCIEWEYEYTKNTETKSRDECDGMQAMLKKVCEKGVVIKYGHETA